MVSAEWAEALSRIGYSRPAVEVVGDEAKENIVDVSSLADLSDDDCDALFTSLRKPGSLVLNKARVDALEEEEAMPGASRGSSKANRDLYLKEREM